MQKCNETVYEDKNHCSGCGACYHSCGLNAIEMRQDEEGFFYPVINQELCVKCGKCKAVCPFVKKVFSDKVPDVYAAKNVKDEVRLRSASGGIFPLLSDFVLEQGGVVYGAVFNDEMQVVHRRATSIEERDLMCGSKYVQSNLEDIFKRVRQDADLGKKVLFTGTPCQVAGLKSYLKKEYPNLYLCDIVCHGVTSPIIFKEYILYIEQKYRSAIDKISFRDKEQGWSNQKWKIQMKSGEALHDNEDVRIFKNLYYGHEAHRPSCHECPYTSIKRQGDISLGDFWGIENSIPEFKDELGVNVVLVNTEKGNEIFEAIKDKIKYLQSDEKHCLQPQLQYPTEKSPKREQFWRDYKRKGFSYIAKKYGTVGKIKVLKHKIKAIIKRI